MQIWVRTVESAKVLKVVGNLTMGEPMDEFLKRIHEQLEGHAKHLVIDLSGVEYLDSSGVGAIAAASVSAHKAGARCGFFGASHRVMVIMNLLNLAKAIELFPDESAALSVSVPDRPAGLAA